MDSVVDTMVEKATGKFRLRALASTKYLVWTQTRGTGCADDDAAAIPRSGSLLEAHPWMGS
eukprot:1226171-Amphidinium_carterae.1